MRKNNYIYLNILPNIMKVSYLLVLVFLLSFVSASIQDMGSVKQNECINITQTCLSCSYNNLTVVQYPNKTYALQNNTAMNDLGGGVYQYQFCDTQEIGAYNVDGNGDLNGVSQGWGVFIFSVTASGNELTMPDSLILILILAIIIIAGIFFIIIAWFSNDQFVKTIFMCLAGFAIVVSIFFGMTIMFNLLPQYTGFMTAYNSFFYIMTIVVLVAVFSLIVWTMVRTFRRMYKMRGNEYDD